MLVKDKDLTAHNTFGIQVKAKWLAEYDSEESLRDILQQVRTEHGNCSEAPLRILHIGQGSNLLFLHDYEGLVLHNTMRDLQVVEEAEDHVKVCVGAGMVWDDFVQTAIARGWFGVENRCRTEHRGLWCRGQGCGEGSILHRPAEPGTSHLHLRRDAVRLSLQSHEK